MSNEGSTKGSNSHSESSNSSSSQAIFMLQGDPKDATDLTVAGAAATVFTRTGTVRRASNVSRKDSFSAEDVDSNDGSFERSAAVAEIMGERAERYRRSLDSTYRHSLESISEYKTKSSFSSTSLFPSLDYGSMDSSSSGCTEYGGGGGGGGGGVRSTPETLVRDEKETSSRVLSPSSSYLTWIESVNSEYFTNDSDAPSVTGGDTVDNKVGEWNNFWLNYSSARGKYMSSSYLCPSNEDKTADDLSDARSTSSTQKEFNEKSSAETVVLTVEEAHEAIRCSQRVTEILQNALRKCDQDVMEDSRNDSYYSQPASQPTSLKEDLVIVQRERSFSYAVDSEVPKQRQLFKSTPQSSSSSCINAILNTGVADILKRVINKKRDFMGSDDPPITHRGSFSDWSTTK